MARRQAGASPLHTGSFKHLYQRGVGELQSDQHDLFDCHVNTLLFRASARCGKLRGFLNNGVVSSWGVSKAAQK